MAYKKLANGEIEIIPEPGLWENIPHDVMFENTITSSARLLYGKLTGLAKDKGYCTIGNAALASLFEVKPRQISRWLAELSQEGFIVIQVKRKKEDGIKRKIYPVCVPHKYEKPQKKNDYDDCYF